MKALCIAMLVVTLVVIGYSLKFSFGMISFYVAINEPIKGVIVFTLWNTGVITGFLVCWKKLLQ